MQAVFGFILLLACCTCTQLYTGMPRFSPFSFHIIRILHIQGVSTNVRIYVMPVPPFSLRPKLVAVTAILLETYC